MHKKRKHHLEQRSTRQHGPHSKPHRHSPKLHSTPDQGSRVTAVSSGEGRLPSPAPSALQTMDIEMLSDCCNLSLLSSDILPTLVEVTFRPHSTSCCSFTAVVQNGCDGQGVSFSQLAQLIKSVGHIGKIDFTIKLIEHHSFLLTGFSHHTSSQPSFGGTTSGTAAEAGRNRVDTTHTRPQYGKAVDTGALASQGSKPSSSDDDGGLANSPAGLGPQYVRAGIWSGPEVNRLPLAGRQAVAQALCVYRTYSNAQDTNNHSLLPVILAITPTESSTPIQGRPSDSPPAPAYTSYRLSLSLEAKKLLESIVEEGGFVASSHFVPLFICAGRFISLPTLVLSKNAPYKNRH